MAEEGANKKFRSWCFTINNPAADVDGKLKDLFAKGVVTYIEWEHEVGEKGTPHKQGFLHLKNPRCLSGMLKHVYYGAHWEPMRGTHEDNVKYCNKTGEGHFSFGEKPKPGKRTDIEDIKQAIKDGKTMNEIIEMAPSYQAAKMAELAMKYKPTQKREKPTVKWFWGPTGTGKTFTAWEESGVNLDDVWCSNGDLKWWDGYYGQHNVIIDDFRASNCKFNVLLRYLDKYPVRVEVKGGSQPLVATQIIVTSAFQPEAIYKGIRSEDVNQLLRRIDEIREFTLGTEVEGNTVPRPPSEPEEGIKWPCGD